MGEQRDKAASPRTELEEAFDRFRRTPPPPRTDDSRIQELHDVWITYIDDVAPAINEILKGTRPFFKLRRYLGIRRNRRVENLLTKLSRSELPSNLDIVLKEYQRQYAHVTKMLDLASALKEKK